MKHIRAIIWDLDKTLYPFDEAFGIASQRALVKMITELKPELTLAQATAYAEPTYPMKTIAKLQRAFDLKAAEMFDRYYTHLDAGFLRPSPDFLREMSAASVSFGILSHCNRDWADRALERLGLSSFIPPHHRVTNEDLGGLNKDGSPDPFRLILARMQVQAGQSLMVEDKDRNLRIARQLGMETVLVTNGDDLVASEHASHIHQTGHDFLCSFNQQARRERPTTQSRPVHNTSCMI